MQILIQFEYNNAHFYVRADSLSIFQEFTTANANTYVDVPKHIEHIKHEYIYQITQYLSKRIPHLKIININVANTPNTAPNAISNMIPNSTRSKVNNTQSQFESELKSKSEKFVYEKLIINEYIYGELFASADLMFTLSQLLNLGNYLKLPKISGIKWQTYTTINNLKYKIAVGEYLYTPSDKLQYLSIKIGYANCSYTIYINEYLVKHLAQTIFTELTTFTDLSDVKYSKRPKQPLDIFYAEAVADMAVGQISYQFNLPLVIEQVQYVYLNSSKDYLPITLSCTNNDNTNNYNTNDNNTNDNSTNNDRTNDDRTNDDRTNDDSIKDFHSTVLMSGWQMIDWQNLSVASIAQPIAKPITKSITSPISELETGANIPELSLSYSLSAGDVSLTHQEITSLKPGDIVLLNNCYMPDALGIDLGKMSAIFGMSKNKLTLNSLS